MQMNNMNLRSGNFVGTPDEVLNGVNAFLEEVRTKNPDKSDFHLVHALVFSKNMSSEVVELINLGLGDLYRLNGFDVLGGDTSSGSELNIFISTIVF